MTNAPHHRLADSCSNCKHGDQGEDAYFDEYRVQCFKHGFTSSEWHICDDWEKDEHQ